MGCSQKTAIITGAGSGIGKAAAVRFAAAGHRVILACRDGEKAERARREVVAASAGRGRVEVRALDVSSLASVRAFAGAFAADERRLDVLIHNAGYFEHGLTTYQRSLDGLELTFATNVFGPLLLTELLLEPLSRSDDPRVLTAGSTNLQNFFDPGRAIEFDNLRGEHAGARPYSVYRMYGDSKMGLLLLTRRMAEAYRDLGIRANCVMIPTVRVERQVLRKFHSWFRVVAPVVQYGNPFALSRERMAETYFQLTTSEAFRDVTGALIDHRGRLLPPLPANRRPNPLALARELLVARHAPAYAGEPENVERMWTLARTVCGLPEKPVLAAR